MCVCLILEISYWIGCYSNLLFMEVTFFFTCKIRNGDWNMEESRSLIKNIVLTLYIFFENNTVLI